MYGVGKSILVANEISQLFAQLGQVERNQQETGQLILIWKTSIYDATLLRTETELSVPLVFEGMDETMHRIIVRLRGEFTACVSYTLLTCGLVCGGDGNPLRSDQEHVCYIQFGKVQVTIACR